MQKRRMNMSVVLEVKDLCKTYVMDKRQNNVLKNVSFKVEAGEMVAIMGPSASGKSTLLYSVSGMDEATSGTVLFNEKDITKMKKNELSDIRLDEMGFIFQQMFMMKNLTILDNILLPGLQSKKLERSRTEVKEYGEALMRKLGIIETADNDINEVSGGQLQRACICRSLINKPSLLFADEPTGALNRASSDEVMQELTKINKEGTSIMMVTHDSKVAAKCTRVLYISDGNIEGEFINDSEKSDRERERALNNWLMDLGW